MSAALQVWPRPSLLARLRRLLFPCRRYYRCTGCVQLRVRRRRHAIHGAVHYTRHGAPCGIWLHVSPAAHIVRRSRVR